MPRDDGSLDATMPVASKCPSCGLQIPPGSPKCPGCGVDLSQDTLAGHGISRRSIPKPTPSVPRSGPLLPETELGERYTIVSTLGGGGMGEVYRAKDNELGREVAIKVIRSNLAEDATSLERFRREVQLATEITHPNVLRVYDVGEAAGIKYLTMQFVDGDDLAGRLKRVGGKMDWRDAAEIARQIALGLDAAHEQGVVHRDLKPRNVLLDEDGHVLVCDFGLAVSVGEAGLTTSGELLGSPLYMAPEQVKGEKVDARADLYALGVMLYEMVTGDVPFKTGTAFEVMAARVHTKPKPVREIAPEVPEALARVIERCMATTREERYKTARRVAEALEQAAAASGASIGKRLDSPSSVPPEPSRPPRRRRAALLVAASGALGIAVAAGGGWWAVHGNASSGGGPAGSTPPPAARALVGTPEKPLKVLVASFDNKTGDSALDDTLEEPTNEVLGGTAVVTPVAYEEARGLVQKADRALSPLRAWLDAAGRQRADVLVVGTVETKDAGYRVSCELYDVARGAAFASAEKTAKGGGDLLTAVGELAVAVREAVGDTPAAGDKERDIAVFGRSTLQATHALEAFRLRNAVEYWDGALQAAKRAVELDPGLGPACMEVGTVLGNMSQTAEADTYFKQAFAHSDRLTARELLEVRARSLRLHAQREAVDAYRDYIDKFPGDPRGFIGLAVAYGTVADYARASEWAKRAVEADPSAPTPYEDLAEYALYAGEREAAATDARTGIRLSPACDQCFFVLGAAAMEQGDVAGALKAYDEARATGGLTAAEAAMGPADVALYEGRAADAERALDDTIEPDIKAGLPDVAGRKLVALAEAELAEGRKPKAQAALARALSLSDDIEVGALAGNAYAAMGQDARALEIASRLDQRVEPIARAHARVIEGEVALAHGRARDAAGRFQEASRFIDLWYPHYGLARALVASGDFAGARAELDVCKRREGEALALFVMSFTPTTRYWPPVLYWTGRAEEGLGMASAVASYGEYLAIRGKADHDDLAADARQRIARLGGAK